MNELTKIHTPLERRRYGLGTLASGTMQSVPLAIGPISGLNLRAEIAVPGCLRGLGIQNKLYLFSYSCEDDRERISAICVPFSLAGPRVACDRAFAIRMFGPKYTTFAGCVCRGRRDFPVKRAEDSGGDDNPVQGCTKRVTLKAERCRRRHFFHIPDRIRATSGQRSPARTTADVTNGPRSRIEGRFADDSTFIPSLRDSHV
jgi:hypothetical protein